MSAILTKEEKAQIINSHIRSLSYSRYNLEIDDIQEKAKTAPNETSTASIAAQIAEIDKQVTALDVKLAAVNLLAE